MSFGFDRSRDKRKRELTDNKNIKGKNHVKNMLRDILRFAEHQQKATYRLGYKLTLTRNIDTAVLYENNALNDAKIKINSIEWLIPQYIASVKQQTILMDQIVKMIPTNLHYVERSVFMQEVRNQKTWQFQSGVEEGMNIQYL